MKKRIAIALLAAAMLMLTACGSEAATTPSAAETEPETQVQETQITEAPTQAAAPAPKLEYAGVYCQAWSEEIGGTIVERNSYIVLNEDHTGNWIVQGVATLAWDEHQLKTTVGEICDIALTQENGTVKLMVYPDQRYNDTQEPNVYEKIEKLPAEIEAMLAEDALSQSGELNYPGVYCQTKNEEIGGTVIERKSYIVLNEDYTGYLFVSDIGKLTWNESQMTDNLGVTYNIALTQENGSVNLLVYEFQNDPSVYEKIEKLPAEIEAMLAEA